MNFVCKPPAIIAVPIAGTDEFFPVRRVYCVGRNYAAHALEMGFDPDREPPFFFCKPADAVVPVRDGEILELQYPAETSNYHYEAELVAVIGESGSNIAEDHALRHIYGYAVGLDMTRRDLQMKMREMGRPWEIGKAFDNSAPIGPIYRVSEVGHISDAAIKLTVNDETKQSSNVSQLIWSVAETVSYLSKFFQLEPGDVIYTGTPEGVGPVKVRDLMIATIDGLGELAVRVV
ncbi:5-carboxymethyl-2-hydroxymuconate isomerase [Burkholderia diffusa]|uniref:5-carboxymethyl-2-hydroxymuconate isomerase n=1 Tax=Burkholderia diffusa TaxID=488732 RepID=A0AAW3P9M5_9BURK|nr:fumarylacetoacetate hydrolase family protein [Burkholderia diffusa]KWF32773.1 5-carboxymethyl-2-hydroxymuconate isomerase [Burkholderia diffusa]KWF38695.1 5-carboxymethyl-2-hydroxymuconate isomerase [Burkholderia diffusa]KWF46740.1 5-carboxymethyl-2-hydroxymuconate isomerase [Burkholderia diffusa]KWF50689.1 5-carboxymethyl-2-hydroxymuconate isomerase [Burkholderia diffusa]